MNRWNPNAVFVALVTSMLFGCAHAPPPQTAQLESHPTAAPAVALPAAQPPARSDQSDLIALMRGDTVGFAFEQATLTQESQHRLQKIADAMRAHPRAALNISGNCDERGTEEYNLVLGQKRADVAKSYLVNLGVDSGRVKTISYGKEKPVASGHDEAAWSKNRRDDLQVQGD